MKIGFLGCGAMGSIYAGNLTKAHEVYIFDAMPAVCEAVNTTGITIDEPDGSTRVYHPVIATTDPSTIGEMDIMIVFVKYLFLESALEKCKTMIGPHTIVLSLQNGIGNYDEIAKVVPEKQICCGTTAHGATNLGPGHSRHTGVDEEQVKACEALRVLAESDEAGIYLMSTDSGRQIFVTGHPEYERLTLDAEYRRDVAKGLPIAPPKHYYPGDDPSKEPVYRWRAHAFLLYTNWLNYYVYQNTPYDLGELDTF